MHDVDKVPIVQASGIGNVQDRMFDAGFDLAHMVGAKFIIRLITGRVFPESWDG